MDDMRVVLDAAGSERAVALGLSEGGALSALFAASHPDRVEALALVRRVRAHACGPRTTSGRPRPSCRSASTRPCATAWGDNAWLLKLWAPSVADDPFAQEHWNRMTVPAAPRRAPRSPGCAMTQDPDIRDVLPAIRVPTLVIHRDGRPDHPRGHGRYLGEHIPGARYVELPGADHLWWARRRRHPRRDRVVRDRRARPPRARPRARDRAVHGHRRLDPPRRRARRPALARPASRPTTGSSANALARFRGDEVKTLGDGFLATFDGPGRAIAAACSIRDALGELGLEVRAGLHTGECERLDRRPRRLAVNIGARVGALARVPARCSCRARSRTWSRGRASAFAERGEHELKGVPGRWRLFAVGSAAA